MTLIRILLVVAVVGLFAYVFIGLMRFIVREWRKIEADEEELRQARVPRSTKAGRELIR